MQKPENKNQQAEITQSEITNQKQAYRKPADITNQPETKQAGIPQQTDRQKTVSRRELAGRD